LKANQNSICMYFICSNLAINRLSGIQNCFKLINLFCQFIKGYQGQEIAKKMGEFNIKNIYFISALPNLYFTFPTNKFPRLCLENLH